MDPIQIPADLTAPYAVPADATVEQLAELRAAAREQAIALLDAEDASDETVAQAEWLASAIDVIADAETSIVSAGEQDERRTALRDRLNPPADDGNDDGGDGGAGTEPVAEAPAADAPAGEPALVAAGARPRGSSVARAAARAPRPVVPAARTARATLTASAESGMAVGSEIDWLAAAGIFERRAQSFRGNSRQQLSVAQVNIPFEDALVASGVGDKIDLDAALEYALDQSRLPGGSLLASSGWCSPSEILYELLNLSTRDGLIDIADIGVRRGGVKWSTGPNFAAVYGAAGLFGTQTEAQNIADTDKTSYTVPCPSWSETRLSADFMNLQAEILATKGFPEGIADFMEKAQIAFAHYVNQKTIADIATGSTAVDLSATTPVAGAMSDSLSAVDLQITDIRYRHRLSLTDALEVKAPMWVKGVWRADIAKRLGIADPFGAASDAALAEWFKQRGAVVQYVYDWQDAFANAGTGFGGASAAVEWPTSVKFLIYPAGTWARALEPVISLDAVYDSALLLKNKYTALFQEQGRATIKRGLDSRLVTVDVFANGFTGPIALAAAAKL